MAVEPSPQDKRGFFMLPQFYEGAGYYTHGTPENGAGQYAHPKMMTFLMLAAQRWSAVDNRKFGVGNISLAGGPAYARHQSHRSGLDVDIRPLRKDGKRALVYCTDKKDYDGEGTAKLIDIMWKTSMVKAILFNDTKIPRVRSWTNHSHHFHVQLFD
jgi:penicillin-insensitive murein DD-endopeptidase